MRIVTVVGARPQFIKAAVLSQALEEVGRGNIEEMLVHTGQHYDVELSAVFFRELDIRPPEINLGVGSDTNGAQTGKMLQALERVLMDRRPDRVLIYGDTNSTLAGALAAAKLHIPVAHVEAGLRSFNRRMPEEINRVVADHLADLLFCPTKLAVENLHREGITAGIHRVGDVMFDCALKFAAVADRTSDILKRLELNARQYFLATVHRAENTDDAGRLRAICDALLEINRRFGPVVWPIHPRSRQALASLEVTLGEDLLITGPLPYLDLQKLMANARCVLTDSGGVQKEAFFHRVPCLTLREETEWLETVENGCNQLVGADTGKIVEAASAARFPETLPCPSPYGDGQASAAIVRVLLGQ